MPLRLMEVALPQTDETDLASLFEGEAVISFWQEAGKDGNRLVRILLSVEHTEPLLDRLEDRFGGREGFRVVLLHVEATLPRIEPEETETDAEAENEVGGEEKETQENVQRISREELYEDIVDSTRLTRTYLALVALSTVVAAVGLLRNNVAIIIGAMVIAPLLGPNVGLALATTLGDFKLGRNALLTGLTGAACALGLSVLTGLLFEVDTGLTEISVRTRVELSDVVLALAAGSAGVLSFTSGVPMALIGVMVAVALLPPLVAVGLLLGGGAWAAALGALLLLLTNLICVNLAGVTTFLVQGIRPRQWWEADQADRATRWAIGLWSVLLAILIVILLLAQRDLQSILSVFGA